MNLPAQAKFNLLPILLLAGFLLCACQPNKQKQAVASIGVEHYFPMHLEGHPVFLQVALTEAEQAQGLMYRESLEPDHGMLFVFRQPGSRAFWMRNTRIPLDLAYLDAGGTILELHKLYPFDERPVKSRSDRISLVLEMNRGWFAAHELGTGSRLDAGQVLQAIRDRGQDPGEYSIHSSAILKQL